MILVTVHNEITVQDGVFSIFGGTFPSEAREFKAVHSMQSIVLKRTRGK